jgi:DNA-binding NtrC family response regulator
MADRICIIADDSPSIRAYLRAILERQQFQCQEADNATQALRIVRRLGGSVDLIVSDIRLAGDMDGIDLAYSVRNSFPAIPVILISGYGEEEYLKRTAASFPFIQKPFVPETILNAVRRIMSPETAKATGATNG